MTPDCRLPHGPALWAPPIALLGAMVMVWAGGWNQPLFLHLNHWGGGDPVWAGLTLFGEPLVALALGLVCHLRRPQSGWALILGGLAAALAVNLLKSALGLPRPLAVLPPENFHQIGELLYWRAMPSGHTATAFLFAAVVFWCADYRIMRWAALTIATLAGLSRIMVGVHWPMDVLAGAALGWLMGALGVWLAGRWPRLLHRRGQIVGGVILGASALALPFYRSGYPEAHALQTAIGLATLSLAAIVLWWRQRERRNNTTPPRR